MNGIGRTVSLVVGCMYIVPMIASLSCKYVYGSKKDWRPALLQYYCCTSVAGTDAALVPGVTE